MRPKRIWFRHTPRREGRHRCTDCRIDIAPETRHHHARPGRWQPIPGQWHWYLVNDDVWAEAGMQVEAWHEDGGRVGSSGYLCIPCLERRLGRPLTVSDLQQSAINRPSDLDYPPLRRLEEQLAAALPGEG